MFTSFDIETGPLAEEILNDMMPEFDEQYVKTGNLKDPAKIAAKIEAAREDHVTKWFERAPLSATTGQVLAIGYYDSRARETSIDHQLDMTEEELIYVFWDRVVRARKADAKMVGVNIFDFDLPFLVRRSWILDIPIPSRLLENNRYWDRSVFVDLREAWLLGQRPDRVRSSFDELGRAFSTGGKDESSDITGAKFHEAFWGDDKEAFEQALEYLRNDVRQPAEWAIRMGVV